MSKDQSRSYDAAALRLLSDDGVQVMVNGSPVLVKESTTTWRDGQLDDWLVARTAELADQKSVGPKPGLGMLFSIFFRPEAFLVQLRERASKYKMTAEADSSVDLTEGDVEVTSAVHTFWKRSNTLWKYERAQAGGRLRPAFLHLHAGGFFVGEPDGEDNFLAYLADRSGAVVFDLDYSLSPEYKYPHAVNEALGALRHIRDHAAEYGVDPERIVVGGGSAGANLTAAVSLLAREVDSDLIALQILMNPVLGLGKSSPEGFTWTADDFVMEADVREKIGAVEDPRKTRAMKVMFNAYRGRVDADHDQLLSPWLATSFKGLPPALITTAEMDPLRSEGEFYAGQLAAAGVPVRTIRYRGVQHESGGQFGYIPQAEAVAIEVIRAINELAPAASGKGDESVAANREEDR